jgi:hypothetical protein
LNPAGDIALSDDVFQQKASNPWTERVCSLNEVRPHLALKKDAPIPGDAQRAGGMRLRKGSRERCGSGGDGVTGLLPAPILKQIQRSGTL